MALLDLLKFVTTGAWGSGLARPLTAAEGDGNIHQIAVAIQEIIDGIATGVELSNITMSGGAVTFYLSDGSTRGPFPLPVATIGWSGEWLPEHFYSAGEIVQVTGVGVYIVVEDHMSPTTFDAFLVSSTGPIYVELGGGGGGGGGGLTGVTGLENPFSTLILGGGNNGCFWNCTNTGGIVVTCPSGLTEAGVSVRLRQGAAGAITFTAGVGATVTPSPGKIAESASVGAIVHVQNVGDQWFIWGDLAPAP